MHRNYRQDWSEILTLTEEFINLVGLRSYIDIECIKGSKNRLHSVVSKIAQEHTEAKELTFDNVRMNFFGKTWIFQQEEEGS